MVKSTLHINRRGIKSWHGSVQVFEELLFTNNIYHRANGPAIMYPDSDKEYNSYYYAGVEFKDQKAIERFIKLRVLM